MSQEQMSIPELLLSLDSSELQEAELVRAAVNQQLNSDRGGAVLHSLVEFYLESLSHQAVLLLSSTRERHHKPLLEKLNECLGRPGSRVAALTLLGHLVQKQPPWVHLVSRSPLLPSLLRCLKTDSDVVVLITGVLVLITLLPMIPQAGKQHIYDFFDVFGRLASWSYKNPGLVPAVQLIHLQAALYSLFHRLYGMFPCNFMSYLRLHYSMKENLDTFQEVLKPMLQQVRVHPELVSGTQDYELDPSRWRCFEVHDIVLECSRVSLDPLESSCEDDVFSSSQPPPHLHLCCTHNSDSVCPSLSPSPAHTQVKSPSPAHTQVKSPSPTHTQADDVRWSPSSHCGLSTPPPDSSSSAPPLTRTASLSGMKSPLPASVSVTPPTEDSSQVSCSFTSSQLKSPPIREQDGSSGFQPIRKQESGGLSDVISRAELKAEEAPPPHPSLPPPLTSTPSREASSSGSLTLAPSHLFPHRLEEEGGPAHADGGPAPSYEQLFELALPRAATLFIRTKTKEALERSAGQQEALQEQEEEHAAVSPLKVLDQLIVYGNNAHQHLLRRSSAGSRSGDGSLSGGLAPPGEELQSLRSQLLLVHGQLQYERFKRQQHAVRNRRLLRRVISATTLEEHSVAMRAQLVVQEAELRCLKESLQEEQRRFTQLQQDSSTHTHTLHTHNQHLLLQLQEEQREGQRLQSELQECQSRMRDLEAELQKVSNKAYNAEHQLTQLSIKLSSSEQQQQQLFLMNQQLVVFRETNRVLSEQLDAEQTHSWTEASMLQCSLGKEFQQLKESEEQHRQKLEAANQRTVDLETQLVKKDQLIQDQKKLLEDTKAQSRCELASSESRCVSLRGLCQALQSEMLHLYSQIHLDTHTHTHSHPPDVSRPNGGYKPRPFSPAVGVANGGVEMLSSSPLAHSPLESPLAVGSFLEQHARQLFGPANQSQEEAEPQHEAEEEEEEEVEEVEALTESPPLGQEVVEATLLTRSPLTEPPGRAGPPATSSSSSSTSTSTAASSTSTSTSTAASSTASTDLTLAVRQRRHELSIMDYNEMLPEF